jgi:hypothetical protein
MTYLTVVDPKIFWTPGALTPRTSTTIPAKANMAIPVLRREKITLRTMDQGNCKPCSHHHTKTHVLDDFLVDVPGKGGKISKCTQR